MCDVDYGGESSDVWDETRPKARKCHTCETCGFPILPGTVYLRIGSLHDGGWRTFRAHVECDELNKFIAFTVCSQEVYFVDSELLGEKVREHQREPGVLIRWRDILRLRRAEGSWPRRRA